MYGGCSRRDGALALGLALLTVLAILLAPAAAAGATWRDALGATAGQERKAWAADLKRRLDAPLRPLVRTPLTASDLDAIKADAERYPDGDRPPTRAAGRAILAHDAELALDLEVLLLRRSRSEATLVAAAADLLASDARTVGQLIADVVQRQIDKDVALLAQGRVQRLEWHFFPSSASDTIGPSRELLDELRRRGIDYVIHLP